jgi:hypothetical protein
MDAANRGCSPVRCEALSRSGFLHRSGSLQAISRERKSRGWRRNTIRISLADMSQVRNRNGHYPHHANSVRRGIRIPVARVQDVRSYEKAQGRAALEAPAQRPGLKVGEVFHIAQTRSVNGPQAAARSRRHHKTSEPHLYFPRRRRALQSERIQRACPQIGPLGRSSTMPRMRRGDFDQTDRTFERTRRRTPHVRMQAMPRATGIHRRSCERNYSCDATLAGRPRRAPPI